MNAYLKTQAIIPLRAAHLAGVVVRGYSARDAYSGQIAATSITLDGELVSLFVDHSGSEVRVVCGRDDSTDYRLRLIARFSLEINDIGEFRLVPVVDFEATDRRRRPENPVEAVWW